MIERLLTAGMDIARLNASHGSLEEHAQRIRMIRQAASTVERPIAIMLDIQGPKLRIGSISPRYLAENEPVVLTQGEPRADEVPIPYERLASDARVGESVFLDDGLIELQVMRIEAPRVYCRVVVGGELRPRKGITLPGARVDLPPMTDEDRSFIRFGVREGIDLIAASFVRRPEHVEAVKEAARQAGRSVPVIAKIENSEGLENLPQIIQVSDGVMVARGDLGVELRPEEVPIVQKRIIALCNQYGKPVITATQMLDSMARNPRPTRAEATDVANAIFDGTDAVMLSGETAVGQYPIQTVAMMDRIVRRSEEALDYAGLLARRQPSSGNVAEAIAHATCVTAADVGATAILCSTRSGATARLVAKFRPRSPVIAVTSDPDVVRQLALTWGVHPILVPPVTRLDDLIDVALSGALRSGLVRKGDLIALAAGVRTGMPGSTNLLQVLTV